MFQIFNLNNTRMIAEVLGYLIDSFQQELQVINRQYLIFNGFLGSLKQWMKTAAFSKLLFKIVSFSTDKTGEATFLLSLLEK